MVLNVTINNYRELSVDNRIMLGETVEIAWQSPADGLRFALLRPDRTALAISDNSVMQTNTDALSQWLSNTPSGWARAVNAVAINNNDEVVASGSIDVVAAPLPGAIVPVPVGTRYISVAELTAALESIESVGDDTTQRSLGEIVDALVGALRGIGAALVALLFSCSIASAIQWRDVPPTMQVNTNIFSADLSQYWKPGQTLTQNLVLDDWVGLMDRRTLKQFFYTPTDDGWTGNLFIGQYGFLSYADAYSIRFQGWNGEQTTLADFVINPWQNTKDYSRNTQAVVSYSPAVLKIDIPADATLVADINNWRDGLAVFARLTAHGTYQVADNLSLLGYGWWPTNNATAIFYRDGTNVFCNILSEY